MNLNKAQRVAILKAASKKVFDKRLEEAQQYFTGVVTDIYTKANAKMLENVENVDPTWLNPNDVVNLEVVSKKDDAQLSTFRRVTFWRQGDGSIITGLNNRLLLSQRFPGNGRYGIHSVTITDGSADYKKLVAAHKKLVALSKEIETFERDTQAVLASCRTHKQLHEAAPQLLALLPQDTLPATGGAVVATATVDKVNKALLAAEEVK